MKALVLGASGATGQLVVRQLIEKDITTRILVRESAIISEQISNNNNVEIIKGNINDFDIEKIKEIVKDCDAVICCLGHNISFKGLFGPPRKLVYNTVVKVVEAIDSLDLDSKFVLMSTTAYTNKKGGEENTAGEKLIFSLLKLLLPPHKDNMLAGDYLVRKLGSQTKINWVAVRPDSLINEDCVSEYEIRNKKMRSPIFDPGKTSRINVGNFMAELVTNEKLWQEWKHKTPVIYNKE